MDAASNTPINTAQACGDRKHRAAMRTYLFLLARPLLWLWGNPIYWSLLVRPRISLARSR